MKSSKAKQTDPMNAPMGLVFSIKFTTTLLVGIVALLLGAIFQSYLEIDINELLTTKGTLTEAFMAIWPLFAVGCGLTLLGTTILIVAKVAREREPGEAFLKGLWLSLNAGVFEELEYRLFRFISASIVLQGINFITFGLMRWLYEALLLPVANFFTLGVLDEQLINNPHWFVAAAIISSNGEFSDAHAYQGIVGLVFSWFAGMVFFWVMFQHGILIAIALHVIYDIAVFSISAIGQALRPEPSPHQMLHAALRRLVR